MKLIPVADWRVTEEQKQLITEVLDSGRLTYGAKTRAFEAQFAELHNRQHALFTSSGTAALQIALHAFKTEYGWADGDEIIVPALTFVATLNVVLYNQLKPVLVDIDPQTLNIDPALISQAITPRTRAILPVHLLGQSADMEAIVALAQTHNLKVIEDSCESMFVHHQGQPVGSRGDVACFSTYLAHLMVTGVGGFITTNDPTMATIMRSMMFHGRDESYLTIDDNAKTGADFVPMVRNRFVFTRQGYSARATELEAALGLGELQHWDTTIRQRQANAVYLHDRLNRLPLTFPWSDPTHHGFMLFPMILDTNERDALQLYLEDHGIHTRHIMPLTNQPIIKQLLGDEIENKFLHTKHVNERGLLIGCHQYLTQDDLNYIVTTIHDYYGGKV